MIALCLLLGISVVGRHGALRTGGVAGLILVCAASSLSPKIRHTDNSKLSSVGVSVRADARLGVKAAGTGSSTPATLSAG